MFLSDTARPPSGRVRIRWIRLGGLLALLAIVIGQALPSATPSPAVSPVAAAPELIRSGVLGEADGAVPDGTSVFDDSVPGVAKLDPDLLRALRRAAADGPRFVVDSGWRSPRYQEQLLREAVTTYGSQAEAARWVATPETSAHVQGAAVDLGPADAAAWLSAHGAAYGLCQIYGNEPWHFELRPRAADRGCPPMYADPTQDPRMRR